MNNEEIAKRLANDPKFLARIVIKAAEQNVSLRKEVEQLRSAMGSNTFYVICCNDSVEHVIVGSIQRAEEKKIELAREHFNRYGINEWRSLRMIPPSVSDEEVFREYYLRRCRWHIQTVPGEMPVTLPEEMPQDLRQPHHPEIPDTETRTGGDMPICGDPRHDDGAF